MTVYHLTERALVKVAGEEASSFLQNLITQDVVKLAEGQLVYGALLTAPGRFLHDFFIFREGDAFFLECEAARRDDLVRRLKIYKLRAKVTIEEAALQVYAADAPCGDKSFADPRLPQLGYRCYAAQPLEAQSAAGWRDKRIALGVPEGADIKPEIDTLADVNLDILPAVAWDKGCFVGQEVAARMHNRGLAKKRLMIVAGTELAAGEALMQQGQMVGDLRAVNTAGTQGLALVKLAALAGTVTLASGAAVGVQKPGWLTLENT